MTRSMVSTLALSALVAGGLVAGTAQAQSVGAQSGTNTGVSVGTPVGGPGVLVAPTGGQVTSPYMTGTPMNSGANAAMSGNVGAAVPPGPLGPSLVGSGPPTDGLDSNPYRDAPEVRKALGLDGRHPQSAGAGASGTARGSAKARGSSTLN